MAGGRGQQYERRSSVQLAVGTRSSYTREHRATRSAAAEVAGQGSNTDRVAVWVSSTGVPASTLPVE